MRLLRELGNNKVLVRETADWYPAKLAVRGGLEGYGEVWTLKFDDADIDPILAVITEANGHKVAFLPWDWTLGVTVPISEQGWTADGYTRAIMMPEDERALPRLDIFALDPNLMTTMQVARYLGVNDSRVRQLKAAGQIEAVNIGRDLYYNCDSVYEYKDRRGTKKGGPYPRT